MNGAILKSFTIEMTKQQAAKCQEEFDAACKGAGTSKAWVLAVQTKTKDGPFLLENPHLQFAVLDKECGEEFSAVLKKYRDRFNSKTKAEATI